MLAIEVGVFVLAPQFPGQSHTSVLRRARDLAVASERAGLAHVWFAEHHFISYGVCPSATTFASYVLGATERITVGTAISILSAQHPVTLGEQTALLDHLSDGRFVLGVGRGGPWMELEVLQTGLDRYDHAFAESLDLLRTWLTRALVQADGEFFRFREVTVVPRPVTQPHPPVLVACTSEATLDLAAARGLPLLLGMHIGDEEKRRLVDRWAAIAERHGHDPTTADHVSAGIVHIDDDRERAVRTLQATMPPWFERGVADYTPVDGRARPRRDHRAYTEFLCTAHPVGDVDDCVARLAESVERTGIRRYALLVEGTGDHDRTLETVTRLGTEVVPQLTKARPPDPGYRGDESERFLSATGGGNPVALPVSSEGSADGHL